MTVKDVLTDTDAQEIIERVSEQTQGFVPDTADKVDWVLSKVADARAAAARIRENAEMMAREKEREADALLWQFGPSLQDFLRRETEGGKKKSVRLFHGVLGYRTKAASFEIDTDRALPWALEAAPGVLRIDKKALSDALALSDTGQVVCLGTGEVVTFASHVPAEEVFYVK